MATHKSELEPKPLEWFGWTLDQCWDELWFLWGSDRVRNHLISKNGGVNLVSVADSNYEEWPGWKRELPSNAHLAVPKPTRQLDTWQQEGRSLQLGDDF